MVLSNIDRDLLDRCLRNVPLAWEEFVDRYIGLVAHVADHVALTRSIALDTATREDLIAEVFYSWVRDDYAVLRRFRGNSSLVTYLTVVARRIVVRKLMKNRAAKVATTAARDATVFATAVSDPRQLENAQEIEEALTRLTDAEATAVRMFHLEGRSYREISTRIGMSENSVGPFLTKAREKLRRVVE